MTWKIINVGRVAVSTGCREQVGFILNRGLRTGSCRRYHLSRHKGPRHLGEKHSRQGGEQPGRDPKDLTTARGRGRAVAGAE